MARALPVLLQAQRLSDLQLSRPFNLTLNPKLVGEGLGFNRFHLNANDATKVSLLLAPSPTSRHLFLKRDFCTCIEETTPIRGAGQPSHTFRLLFRQFLIVFVL